MFHCNPFFQLKLIFIIRCYTPNHRLLRFSTDCLHRLSSTQTFSIIFQHLPTPPISSSILPIFTVPTTIQRPFSHQQTTTHTTLLAPRSTLHHLHSTLPSLLEASRKQRVSRAPGLVFKHALQQKLFPGAASPGFWQKTSALQSV